MEYPPLSHFLVILVLLSTFTLLVLTIPYDFYVLAKEYRQQDIPEYFEALDLSMYANTYVINITDDDYEEHWGPDETGHHMKFSAWTDIPGYWGFGSGHVMINEHYYKFWIWNTGYHRQEWITKNGISRGLSLQDEDIDLDFNKDTDIAEYSVKCKHFEMNAWIHYDSETFSCSKDAWDNYDSEPFNGISILFAIDFDEMGTGMNAWNMIGMILFFQMPQVHLILNLLIAIPLWVCIAWLTFAFIIAVIKSLPFT